LYSSYSNSVMMGTENSLYQVWYRCINARQNWIVPNRR